ncbi:hypothetical protein VDGE_30526 [Verticillium dahliae]|uniref:Extracellular membrane protein CFEM domain-containing protein n=1 Tax=Verticillium dahliae TaxID=27337 RepID=A0A444RKY9_VERDA|nr:hypothetical protein VDGE_30526 [Verticillium dahliae]
MRTIALVTLFTRLACAQITQHVTDLSIFNLLAPCASSAVSYNVEALTNSSGLGCGTDEARLQSCICSQSDVSSQVAQNVSEGVQSQCGKSATGDLWSASQVLKQYCSPDETITFSTPTTNVVMRYITDIDKMNFLAPKGDVVELVRSELTSRILDNCDNREDVGIATEIYSEYCAMNNGTTSFAPIDNPAGDMTYHITALSQYSSLPECARRAVSRAVIDQTSWNCAAGPQALASCVCMKEGILYDVYESMTVWARLNCGFQNKDPLHSANDVLNYYCSAAESQVVAVVTDTATQHYPTASEGGGSGSGAPQATGASGDDGSSGDSAGDGGGGGISQAGTIAAAVLGGVFGLVIIIAIIFWLLRRSKTAAAAAAATETPESTGKPELDTSAGPASGIEVDMANPPSISTMRPESSSPGQIYRRPELQGTTAAAYSIFRGQPPQEPAELQGAHV